MNYYIVHIIVFLIVFTSCNNAKEMRPVDSSYEGLALVNGVLELNDIPFSGKITSNFSAGELRSEVYYLEGKKHGSEKHWYQNGTMAQERYYENGFKVGIHKAWWETNQPKFVYHFNNKGAFNGAVNEWYRSGQPYMRFHYTNGKEEGSQRLWKVDGTIKANYEVVGGERFGLIGLKKCYNMNVSEARIIAKKD